MIRRALLLLGLLLSGCARDDELQPFAVVRRADVWQAVIREPDRSRLARLSAAWEQAEADIAEAGATAELASLGPVADAAAPVQGPLPVAGAYRCRVIRLGWRQGTQRQAPAIQAGDWAPCQLQADGIVLRLATAPAAQMFVGRLYPDVDRLVFLGSVRLADDLGELRYGEDRDRDQLGVLTALGDGHWRLALPWPRWSARLILIEIRAG
jgi:hypothetical protein